MISLKDIQKYFDDLASDLYDISEFVTHFEDEFYDNRVPERWEELDKKIKTCMKKYGIPDNCYSSIQDYVFLGEDPDSFKMLELLGFVE